MITIEINIYAIKNATKQGRKIEVYEANAYIFKNQSHGLH